MIVSRRWRISVRTPLVILLSSTRVQLLPLASVFVVLHVETPVLDVHWPLVAVPSYVPPPFFFSSSSPILKCTSFAAAPDATPKTTRLPPTTTTRPTRRDR